tara:strand:+ start:774 stop:1319 length:546 start_codon:yes stop_codon:yes gene_type:complete
MIASTQTNHPLPAARNNDVRPSSQPRIDVACARLKSAGLRITQPRIAILEALLRQDEPITIEQLHAGLTRARCDLVTVYRCLAAFEELGLVRRCFLHNGTALFQISLTDDAVFHVINRQTGVIETLDPSVTSELAEAVEKMNSRLTEMGYEGVGTLVEFFANKSATAAPARAQASLVGVSA